MQCPSALHLLPNLDGKCWLQCGPPYSGSYEMGRERASMRTVVTVKERHKVTDNCE